MADEFDDISNKLREANQALKDREKLIARLEQRENVAISKQLEQQVRADEYEKRRHVQKARNAKMELNIQRRIQADIEDQLKLEQKEIEFYKNQVKELESKEQALKEIAAKEEKRLADIDAAEKKRRLDKAEGLRQFEKSFRMIPGIGGAIAHAFDKAADVIEEGGSGLKAMSLLLRNFGNILGPAAILGAILEVNRELGTMHKQLGVGFESALRMRGEFAQIAQESGDARITTTKLIKAQIELTNQLGVLGPLVTQFSGDNLKNFINTTEYLGASAESAAKLQIVSAATGTNIQSYTESLAVAAQQSEKTYGIHLPLKNVVESISKMQGATLAYIIDQPKQLVKSIAIAEKLGLSFQKIRTIAEGLTKFEQSITSELEAELFLGRNINLNKARQLAFLGKEAELSEEILKQVGSLSDFQNMLPIQQESFARALGMTRDEMAGVLMRQEMIAQYGDKAARLSREQLENAKQIAKDKGISVDAALVEVNSQVDATKKFEDAVLKIKSAIADLVANLSPMIDRLADFVGKAAASPFAKIAVGALAALGTGSAIVSAFKAFRGVTPATPLYTSDVMSGGRGMGGTGMGLGLTGTQRANMVRQYGSASAARTAMMRSRGIGVGAVAGLAGMAVSASTESAMGKGFGKGLSMAGTGAMIGSMILPVWGTAIGAAIGGLYGGVTGYLDQKEAEREAKRAEIQKEIDERGAVADELKQIKKLLAESESGVYIDGDRVGMSLLKGASMPKASYEL